MKTIEETSKKHSLNVYNGFDKDETFKLEECIKQSEYDFKKGIEFAQQWISVKIELPPRKTKIVKQPNGNTLYFYENYLVKGFWNNEAKSEEIRMAKYLPCSACWYFDVHKSVKTLNFTITHWRPIEYK